MNTRASLHEIPRPDEAWTLIGSFVDEPAASNGIASGYQYCGHNAPDGYANAIVGSALNVVCRKQRDSERPGYHAPYKWTAHLRVAGAPRVGPLELSSASRGRSGATGPAGA